MRRRRRQRFSRTLALALLAPLPACLLLLAAEGGARLLGLGAPELYSAPLPEEGLGLLRQDPNLFWSLTPGFRGSHKGVPVTINDQGLRSPPIEPKRPGEFRVLSLGESTTFGVAVRQPETYSARLERLLEARAPGRRFVVINAGVPAYSSFQSLKYLELRGLALEPDLVLFYHEANDYLPSSIRDETHSELGFGRTDRQLYESLLGRAARVLQARSALYRFLVYRVARRRAEELDRRRSGSALSAIGLEAVGLPTRLFTKDGNRMRPTALVDARLGPRVSESERLENLEELRELCARRGVGLIVLHPSYADSRPHECVLTRFCRDRGVPMLETYPLLHPTPGSRALFHDVWHPVSEGHRRLAEALARMVLDRAGKLSR